MESAQTAGLVLAAEACVRQVQHATAILFRGNRIMFEQFFLAIRKGLFLRGIERFGIGFTVFTHERIVVEHRERRGTAKN